MKYGQYYGDEILFWKNGVPIKEGNLSCKKEHRINRFCNNKTCQSDAFCCSEQACIYCEYQHQRCHFKSLKNITQVVQSRFKTQQLILSQVLKIEECFLKWILGQSHKQLIQKISFWKLDADSLSLIDRIYFGCDKDIKAKSIKASLIKLQDQVDGVNLHKFMNTAPSQFYKNCQQEKQIISQALLRIRQKLFSDPLLKRSSPNPFNQIQNLMKQQIAVKNYPQNESKIFSNDKNGLKKFKYLIKQLDFPSQIKLLYRASQHQFKANKFHELCDGLSNTLTLIKTEFGKTIAGYTPLKWSSQNSYLYDQSHKSFLLQLDFKQKMSLCKPQYAIYNNSMYGPVFGFFDIYISDNCNQNQESYTNFPYSYNKNHKYKNSQQSYFTLCGPSQSRYFRVIEYEVFQVFK